MLPLEVIRYVDKVDFLSRQRLIFLQDKVLVFGQSAGAFDSFTLASLPEAASVMNAVVMQSGGGVDVPNLSQVQAYHADFVKHLNCSTEDVSTGLISLIVLVGS